MLHSGAVELYSGKVISGDYTSLQSISNKGIKAFQIRGIVRALGCA